MGWIVIDQERCCKDGACALVCPVNRLRLGSDDGFPEIVPGKETACIRCGHCVAVCPHAALAVRKIAPEQCLPLSDGAAAMDWSDIAGLVQSRRSIRRFRDEEVPKETLERLLDLVRWAPTACNGQPVKWIVVSGRDKVREMAGMVVDWARGKQVMMPDLATLWEQGEDWPLRGAPHVAMAYGPKGFGPADFVIAATTLELAAASQGIGACWAGFFAGAANSHAPLAEFLGIPEDQTVQAALMLGYSKFGYHRIPPRQSGEVRWI